MTIDQAAQPCARKDCSCEVAAGQTYCSPHCANASIIGDAERIDSIQCACGHTGCSGGIDVQARAVAR